MIVVPFMLELASNEQWYEVEKKLREMKICFFEGEKIEGMTLEEVEKVWRGHSNETTLQRSRQL